VPLMYLQILLGLSEPGLGVRISGSAGIVVHYSFSPSKNARSNNFL
jgi:hypothetical protein